MRALFVLFKWTFYISLLVLIGSYFLKDRLPDSSYYDLNRLTDPVQRFTSRDSFILEANEYSYQVEPKFSYELHGIVVSYNNADAFADRWHKRMEDFANIRDLCVMWGGNIELGLHQRMSFSSDSFTCNSQWKDHQTYADFSVSEMSNNHLLVQDNAVKQALLSAEPGDHIRIKGSLVHYRNNRNNRVRKTSTVRTDTGNGACETIFVDEFEILKKANPGMRTVYSLGKWIAGLSFVGFVMLSFVAPVRFRKE